MCDDTFWSTLAGAFVGGTLSWITTLSLHKTQREQAHKDARVELYGQWIRGARTILNSVPVSSVEVDWATYLNASDKLDIIERDADLRRLRQAVSDAIPEPNTRDYEELEMRGDAPSWEWPPFELAMSALKNALHEKLGKTREP